MSNESCENCRYCLRNTCRRNPPVLTDSDEEEGWPWVGTDLDEKGKIWWCGKWKRAKDFEGLNQVLPPKKYYKPYKND